MARSGRTDATSTAGRQKQRLRAAVEPVVTAAGYDLEELAVSRAGNRGVVRVVVDGEHGVGADEIAELSREVSAALDAAEQAEGPISRGRYTLEVSSRGVDRPLTEPRHWRRNRGRLVKVRIGEASRTGRVLAADDDTVRLDADGEVLQVPYRELGPGKVQIEFDRPNSADPSEDGSRPGADEGKEEA